MRRRAATAVQLGQFAGVDLLVDPATDVTGQVISGQALVEPSPLGRVLVERRNDDNDNRLRWAWKTVLWREAQDDEIEELARLLHEHRDQYAADREAAEALVSVGISPRLSDIDAAELAAWTSVSRVLLNLNETITRN